MIEIMNTFNPIPVCLIFDYFLEFFKDSFDELSKSSPTKIPKTAINPGENDHKNRALC